MSRLTAREIEEIRRVKRAAAGEARDEGLDVRSGQGMAPGQSRRDTGLFTLLARMSGLAGLAWFLRYKIMAPIRRGLRVRRVAAELNRLDARLLDDIGVERALIDAAAEGMVRRVQVPPRPSTGLASSARDWLVRRRTAQALERLDDRMLEDIGIKRVEIYGIAKRIQKLRFAGRPAGLTAAQVAASAEVSTRPLRQWNLSRPAANEMAHRGPEAMANLG
ncbi:MAG: DUF1127 domain-containing protein [Kiloniellales bacterium]